MSSIFISYSHHDSPRARRLAVDLRSRGVTVWIDDAEVKIGDSLVSAIQSGIAFADYFGIVLSPSSVSSPWVQRELYAAFAQEDAGRLKILPLLFVDCEVPLFLANRLWIDFRTEDIYADSLGRLVGQLSFREARRSVLSLPEAEAVIHHFAATYGLAIRTITAAPLSPFGTASFKARITDGKGVLYCHASGSLSGKIFYVSRGIGWYYEHELKGSVSALGLPTSSEELSDQGGNAISLFEGGYIEWTPTTPPTSNIQAVVTISGTEQIIGRRRV